jgi:hypothetical protein
MSRESIFCPTTRHETAVPAAVREPDKRLCSLINLFSPGRPAGTRHEQAGGLHILSASVPGTCVRARLLHCLCEYIIFIAPANISYLMSSLRDTISYRYGSLKALFHRAQTPMHETPRARVGEWI